MIGELGLNGMVSVSESSEKHRNVEEAKDTDRLQSKMESSRISSNLLRIRERSTAGVETEPNPFGYSYVKRGKPVFLLLIDR